MELRGFCKSGRGRVQLKKCVEIDERGDGEEVSSWISKKDCLLMMRTPMKAEDQKTLWRTFDNLSCYFFFGTHSNGMDLRCKLMRGMGMRESMVAEKAPPPEGTATKNLLETELLYERG